MADAVLVQIAPDAQVGKGAVCCRDFAVLVGVQVFDCVKTIGGQLPVALERVHAKELTARVDGAVAIAIEHQPAVIRLDPTGTGLHAIGIVVEQDDGAVAGAGGFNAIAVEVEDQGVAARRGGAGGTGSAGVVAHTAWPRHASEGVAADLHAVAVQPVLNGGPETAYPIKRGRSWYAFYPVICFFRDGGVWAVGKLANFLMQVMAGQYSPQSTSACISNTLPRGFNGRLALRLADELHGRGKSPVVEG